MIATKHYSTLNDIKEDFGGEDMTIQLTNSEEELEGVYFDGDRLEEMKKYCKEDIAKGKLYVYQCRASDYDPMGAPVTVAPLGKPIIVNFAGSFVTDKKIAELDDETDIEDYSY